MLLASKEGRVDEANKLNDELMPLHKRLFLEANPIPVKRALQLMGRIEGGIRAPLVTLDDSHLSSLQEALIIGGALNK